MFYRTVRDCCLAIKLEDALANNEYMKFFHMLLLANACLNDSSSFPEALM